MVSLSRWVSRHLLKCELTRGTIVSLAWTAANAGVGFAATVALSYVLGVTWFGTYNYVLNWLNIVVCICALGFNHSLPRYVSEYATLGKHSLLHGILLYSFRAGSLFALLVVIGWRLGLFLSSGAMGADRLDAFRVGVLLLPLATALRIGEGALQGLKHVGWSVASGAFVPSSVVLVSVVVVLLSGGDMGPGGALWLCGLGIGGGCVCALLGLAQDPSVALSRSTKPEFVAKRWLASSGGLVLLSGTALLALRLDVIMIGILIGDASVGLYMGAVRIAQIVLIGQGAVSIMLSPVISQFNVSGRRDELQRTMKRAAGMVFVWNAVMACGLLIGGEWVLRVFGREFEQAGTALWILAVGLMFESIAGMPGNFLIMTGRQNGLLAMCGVALILNLGLNLLLIPLYGITGAALATAVSRMLLNWYAGWEVCRSTGVHSWVSFAGLSRKEYR